jgi:SAM-dependent methyltransferase
LAPNVKASTATKVFEEALRILRPGGHVYLVDYDGRTVDKLPVAWRALLRRVDQFDPDEMQSHGMQEDEIRKILSCVGSTRSTQRLDQGYSLARWVGVLPPSFSLH